MDGAVIVTGASRGLGRGIARHLAAAGYSVVITFRSNTTEAETTVAHCREHAEAGGFPDARFVAIKSDIGSSDDRRRLVDRTIDEFGSIRGLVNNAGIAPRERRDILDASEESFSELLNTNLQGPYFLTQLVAQHWLADDGAALGASFRAIVFVTSISATTVSLNRGEYCVSKAGLAMASQLWATRLAPQGIGVYEVRPGIMETDMTAGVRDRYTSLIADGLVPQRRWGTPEDVGRAVRSLMDGDFAFSTGSAIYSDGGFHVSRL